MLTKKMSKCEQSWNFEKLTKLNNGRNNNHGV